MRASLLSSAGWPGTVLASGPPAEHRCLVMMRRELLDKVKAELVAVSASATSKREEAANLARIWAGRGPDADQPVGRHRKAESA